MKNTKKAMLASTLSFILCFVMLIGTTYAWFTSSASTTVNTIQSGTLKVDLQDRDGKSLVGETLQFKKATGAESEPVIWEPGCSYEIDPVYVVNKGNLALKYKIVVNGITGDAELFDVIKFDVTMAGQNVEEGKLLKGQTSEALVIKGTMDKDAGNRYQGLSLDAISITVYATQASEESDSYNNTYDNAALYKEDLPFAKVTKVTVSDADVDVAYAFTAVDDAEAAETSPYANWHADFVVTFDKNVAANTLELGGAYESWKNGAWQHATIDRELAKGQEIRLLKDALGADMSYYEICTLVKNFVCGATDLDGANVGMTATVELRLYETEAPSADNGNSANVETGNYEVIGSYSYTF